MAFLYKEIGQESSHTQDDQRAIDTGLTNQVVYVTDEDTYHGKVKITEGGSGEAQTGQDR